MKDFKFNVFFLLFLISIPQIRPNLLESYKKIDQKILSFLSNKQKVQDANDAISSVLSLLQDLQGSNREEQEKADARYNEESAKYEAAIIELQNVYEDNTKHFAAAQDDYETIQEKKNDTTYALQWIQERIKSNSEKIEKLAAQRCESNALFIENLREHQEGMEVLEWLQQDLENLKNKGVLFLQDGEIQTYTQKLTGYSQIYEKQAIMKFIKLGQQKQNNEGDELLSLVGNLICLCFFKFLFFLDLSAKEDGNTENDQDFQVQSFDSQVSDRNIEGSLTSHVLDLVEQLIKKLEVSIAELEKYEIQSSREFATFKSKLNSETTLLNQEFEAKTVYLGKVKIDEEVAFSVLNKAEETMKKSEALLNSNIEEYTNKKNFYLAEKARREEENNIIDQVILVYKEKVVDAQQYLKDKVQDYVEDEDFDQTREDSKKKRTDELIKETGRIKEIVEEEANNQQSSMLIDEDIYQDTNSFLDV